MSIADQYGIKVPYGSRLKTTGPSKSGKADKQIHEIFEKEDPAPAAAKKTAKPDVAAKKPVVEALKETIEKIEAVKVRKGRPKKGEKVAKLVPITLMVTPALAEKMKLTKNWQELARNSLDTAF